MSGFFSAHELHGGGVQKHTVAQCGACGLCRYTETPLPVYGTGNRRIMFIGEAPSAEEMRTGRGLSGKTGSWFKNFMQENFQLSVASCTKTNALQCAPRGKVAAKQVKYCRPRLLEIVNQYQPNLIIPMGLYAMLAVVGVEWRKNLEKINNWAGLYYPSSYWGAWVAPTFHPAYLTKKYDDGVEKEDAVLTGAFRLHMANALTLEKKKLAAVSLQALEDKIEIIHDRRTIRQRLRALGCRASGVLAFDYETTGLKPDRPEQKIVSVAWSLDGVENFAHMVDESLFPEISKILKNPKLKKVASNMKFEERWTRAKLGHGVAGWHFDTMLAAHVLDNRPGITSVKFQAFQMFGIADYNGHIEPYLRSENSNGMNRIRELDTHSLLLYNGLDSLLEYMVYKKQWRVLRDR